MPAASYLPSIREKNQHAGRPSSLSMAFLHRIIGRRAERLGHNRHRSILALFIPEPYIASRTLGNAYLRLRAHFLESWNTTITPGER